VAAGDTTRGGHSAAAQYTGGVAVPAVVEALRLFLDLLVSQEGNETKRIESKRKEK
jgi:hypothetical protein